MSFGFRRLGGKDRVVQVAARMPGFALVWLAAVPSAGATEWTFCGDDPSTVSLGLLLGQAETIAVVAATIEHGSDRYTTSPAYGEGTVIRLRNLAAGETSLSTDFADDASGKPLGDLRLALAKEGDTTFYRGTLRLAGQGEWTVSCDDE